MSSERGFKRCGGPLDAKRQPGLCETEQASGLSNLLLGNLREARRRRGGEGAAGLGRRCSISVDFDVKHLFENCYHRMTSATAAVNP